MHVSHKLPPAPYKIGHTVAKPHVSASVCVCVSHTAVILLYNSKPKQSLVEVLIFTFDCISQHKLWSGRVNMLHSFETRFPALSDQIDSQYSQMAKIMCCIKT